jgi:dTDP-4-dehydrorhamnose reductase
VVRAALMMGPTLTLRRSFFDQLVDKLKGGETQRLYTDEWRSSLSLRSAARAMLDLTERSTEGVLHLAGRQLISRYELGQCVARALDLPADGLQKGQRSEYRGAEPRQKNLALTCERLDKELPDWDPGDLETEIRAMMAERTL